MHAGSTLEAKKRRRRRRRRRSTPSPLVAISMVLDDDDLLGEILLRVAFTTSLVRAALVCRRWLRAVSDPAFLRRFCDVHLPRLLGFYVQPKDLGLPKFVPMPNLTAELASIARRASSALNGYASGTSGPKVSILSCMHGYLLVRLGNSPNNSRDVLLNLLPRFSRQEAVILPPAPSAGFFYGMTWIHKYLQNNGSVRIHAEWHYLDEQYKRTINICELRDGAWHSLTPTAIELPLMPDGYATAPVGSKAYLISSARSIAAARSASSSGTSCLPMITFPAEGVGYRWKRNFSSWGADDDSVIHLIHVKELQLHVWHYAMESQNWSLEDTICLRKVCANSGVKTALVSQDGQSTASDVKVYADWHLGDAKSVLLEVGIDVLYIDIKSRTAKKIYSKTPEDADWDKLLPFAMIAPPMFPDIKAADGDQI